MISNWKIHLISGLCKYIPALQWLTWSIRHIKHVQRERWCFSEEVEPSHADSCHDGLTGFEHEPPAWVAWQSVTLPMRPPPLPLRGCLCSLLFISFPSAYQQTRDTDPMLVQCWPAVYDVGPTLTNLAIYLLPLSLPLQSRQIPDQTALWHLKWITNKPLANTGCSDNVGLMLGRRRRRWDNNKMVGTTDRKICRIGVDSKSYFETISDKHCKIINFKGRKTKNKYCPTPKLGSVTWERQVVI